MSRSVFLFLLLLRVAFGLCAQTAEEQVTDTTPPFERPVTWMQLIPNILNDQKQMWTAPVRAFRNKKTLVPMLGVAAITAGLVAADGVDTGYFRRTSTFHGFNSVFSSNTTALGTALVPAAFYVAGLIQHDSYSKKTALLAGEAVADAEILTTVLKGLDRRVRPRDLATDTKFGDTWFEAKGTKGGFPSGHAIAAFSVATVIARRYPHHRWLPYVAYGLAGAVAFSRITSSAHFPSDVFFGAALGYSISRFSVLRQ